MGDSDRLFRTILFTLFIACAIPLAIWAAIHGDGGEKARCAEKHGEWHCRTEPVYGGRDVQFVRQCQCEPKDFAR